MLSLNVPQFDVFSSGLAFTPLVEAQTSAFGVVTIAGNNAPFFEESVAAPVLLFNEFSIADGVATSAFGTSGDDVLFGSSEGSMLLGLAGDDALFGGDGADVLIGGDGADMLQGGAGADLLIADDALIDVDALLTSLGIG